MHSTTYVASIGTKFYLQTVKQVVSESELERNIDSGEGGAPRTAS